LGAGALHAVWGLLVITGLFLH